MASTYPGSVDTFATTSPSNLGDDDSTARNHAERHDDMGAAMMATQTRLSAVYSPYHADMVATGYCSSGIYFSSTSMTEGYETGSLIIPNQSATVDRIAVYVVTTAGSAGAVIRLGIRNWDAANGRPGTVVLDASTVDATTTGFKTITISQALVAGVPYVLTATCQGGASTKPTVSTILGRHAPVIHASTPVVGSAEGWQATGVTGALTDAPTWSVNTGHGIRVWLRAAA